MPEPEPNPFVSPVVSTEPVQPGLTLADLPEGCFMATSDATVWQAEPLLDLKHFALVKRVELSLILGTITTSFWAIYYFYFAVSAPPQEKWFVLLITFFGVPPFVYFSQEEEGQPFDTRLAKRLLAVRNLDKQTRHNIHRNFFVIEEFSDGQDWPTHDTMLDAGLIFLDKDQGLTLEGAHYRLCVPWDGIYLCELVEPKRWFKKVPMVRLILRLTGGPYEIFLRPGNKPLLTLNFSGLRHARDLYDRIMSELIARRDAEKPHPTLSPDNHSSSENMDA